MTLALVHEHLPPTHLFRLLPLSPLLPRGQQLPTDVGLPKCTTLGGLRYVQVDVVVYVHVAPQMPTLDHLALFVQPLEEVLLDGVDQPVALQLEAPLQLDRGTV